MVKPLAPAQLDWFAHLPPPAIQRIEAASRRRNVVAGQRVIERGDRGDSVLFVLQGHLMAAHWTEAGREIIYNEIGPGHAFGELSVLTEGMRSLTLYARSDCQLLEVPGSLFLELVDSHPTVRRGVIAALVGRIHALTDRIHQLSSLRVEDRLRSYLARRAEAQGGPQAGMVLKNLPTHAEIGNIIGANREAVSRAFALLRERGVIKPGRQSVRILHPEALSVAPPE